MANIEKDIYSIWIKPKNILLPYYCIYAHLNIHSANKKFDELKHKNFKKVVLMQQRKSYKDVFKLQTYRFKYLEKIGFILRLS